MKIFKEKKSGAMLVTTVLRVRGSLGGVPLGRWGRRMLSAEQSWDLSAYNAVTDEYLEKLGTAFEALEGAAAIEDAVLSDGVLTVQMGGRKGTYVINKQTPNRQIWLSSPVSGPKRYDYAVQQGQWTNTRDQHVLDQLLDKEVSQMYPGSRLFKK